ncbi:MAG: outer membrane lipoprotein-sorting protein [Deltaproteobacteria bacterium]|nr:outer membrane lipoprotein-sorting protein [Deltaproteobacteria bacterium]
MRWISKTALDWPRATLLVCALVTLSVGAGGLRLELRTDGEALLPDGHPVVRRDVEDRLRFRDPRTVLLLVDARPGGKSLATKDGFRYLRELHARLEGQDVLQPGGIVSIAGLPRLGRDSEQIDVGRSLDRIPDDPEEFATLLAELRARSLVDGLLLARDGKSALFVLPLSEATSVEAAVASLSAFVAAADDADFELLLGGPLVAETGLGEQVLSDLARLVPLMIVAIAALLFAMLGSVGGVLLPLAKTGVVLIATFGAMGWAGAPISLVSTILPVVLMATCITDEVHLLERLAARPASDSRRARVEAVLAEIGRPIVLTSVTTALGFLSFTSTSIGPLRGFGLFASFGILLAMCLSFSAIPALISLLPERLLLRARRPVAAAWQSRIGASAARRPGACFALATAALLLVLPGVFSLRVSDSWVENFDPDTDLVRADRRINESFWGTYRLDVVLEGEPGLFRDPPGVALVERVCQLAAHAPHVGGCESELSVLEELAGPMGVAKPLSALPAGQLWDLFTLAELSEASGLAHSLTDTAARVRLYVRSPDYAQARELLDRLERELATELSDTGVRHHLGGDLAVSSALVEAIVYNQLRSIAWSLITVALLLLAVARRLSALLAVVPVCAASLGLFGWMGLAGIELGIATSMFASLAVGVGVDFGIHFIHRYELELREGAGFAAAIRGTFEKTGNGLLWNSLVLAAGFSVLITSSLKPNHSLGLLLAGAVIACHLATLLLLPLLLRPGSRSTAIGVASLLLAGALAQPSSAAELPCAGAPDAEATALMARLERARRGQARIEHIRIETVYPEGSRLASSLGAGLSAKTLWGAVNGDPDETWILFVFSGPGRMAGTSLLIQDFAGAEQADGTWFYLRAFESFRKLEGRVERAVVPGSALSYEDAREYIATAKYTFRAGGRVGERGVRVIACPATPELADRLGYGALLVDVDEKRELVERIDYRGPGGGPLKRYELVDAVRVGDRELPREVALVHVADGFENRIHYEYWPTSAGLPAELFRPDLSQGGFLERLRALLHERGLGERIDAELEQANASMRAYDERARSERRGP